MIEWDNKNTMLSSDAEQNQCSLQVDTHLPVLASKVGWLIGKNGNFISSLRERSGCEIHIDTNIPHQDMGRAWINVRMRGSRSQTDKAMKIIMTRLDYMQTLLSRPLEELEDYRNGNRRRSNRQVPASPGHGHSSGDGDGNGNGHSDVSSSTSYESSSPSPGRGDHTRPELPPVASTMAASTSDAHASPGEYSVWEPASPKVQELEPAAEGGSDGGRAAESPELPAAAMEAESEADAESVGVKAGTGVGLVMANHVPFSCMPEAAVAPCEPSSAPPAAGVSETSDAHGPTWREAGSEEAAGGV